MNDEPEVTNGDSLRREVDQLMAALGEKDWTLLSFHAGRVKAEAEKRDRQERFLAEVHSRRRAMQIENGRHAVGRLMREIESRKTAPPELCDRIEGWLRDLDRLDESRVADV